MDRQSRAFEQLQDTFLSTTNNHSVKQNQPQGSSSFNNRNKNQNCTNWTQNFPRSKSSNPSNKSFEYNNTLNRNIDNAKPLQSTANSSKNPKRSFSFSGSKQPMRNATANRSRTKYLLDQQDQYIGNCPQFLSLDFSRRNSEAKKNSLCFNCRSSSHAAKNCTSKVLCRHCNGKHHSLLHTDKQKAPKSTNVTAIDLPMCAPLDQQDKKRDIRTPVYNPGFPSRTRNQIQVIPVTLFGIDNKKHNCYSILTTVAPFHTSSTPLPTR